MPRDPDSGVHGPVESSRVSLTLRKGLLILKMFDIDHPEWTIKEICRQVGVPKPTAYRLLRTLQELDFIAFDSESGKYRLGPSMLRGGYLTPAHSHLAQVANPHMQHLVGLTGETVSLTVNTDQGPMIVDIVLTPQALRPYYPIGTIMGYQSVHGRVFAAFGSVGDLQAVLEAVREPRTSFSITDPHVLLEELARIKREGVAYGLQEFNLGINALGVPVLGSDGKVIASMALVGPAERLDLDEMHRHLSAVKAVAARISCEMGYEPDVGG